MIMNIEQKFETCIGEVELEVASFIDDNNEEVRYITHDSLTKIVRDNKMFYEFHAKTLEPSHSVVECVMQDYKTEYRVIGVGESFYKELDNNNKANPSSAAYKRAFDNATLLILGLPSKYLGNYSSDTPVIQATEKSNEKLTFDDIAPKVEPKVEKQESKSEVTETPKANDGFEATQESFPTENKPDSNNELLNTVLDFGPAKGMSVKEILDNPSNDKVIKFKTLFNMIDKIPDAKQRALLENIKKLA